MNIKTKIRSKALKFRRSLRNDLVKEKSLEIIRRIECLDCFRDSVHILFYSSFDNEPETKEIIQKYIGSKKIYLPVITACGLSAVRVDSLESLTKNHYGIFEPADKNEIGKWDDKIELVITPGTAFDKKGNRIGMGKGYYDRYFRNFPQTVKIGVAYEKQIIDIIPKDEYDVPVDYIVTDQNTYICD